MEEKNLPNLLQQLRAELSKARDLDEPGRQLLRDLDADIRRLLESAEEPADESVLGRLQDSIDHFETTHPTLTTALSQLLNALSNAGI